MKNNFFHMFLISVVSLFGISNVIAGDLPKNIAWTAYGTTSSGYAQSVGIGQMLKKIMVLTYGLYLGKMMFPEWFL